MKLKKTTPRTILNQKCFSESKKRVGGYCGFLEDGFGVKLVEFVL